MSDEQIIRHCAPTLACIKTGSLFSCPCDSRESANIFVRQMNRRLMGKGLRVLPLRFRNGLCLFYVYRPQKLEDDLRGSQAKTLLADCGYACENANGCLRKLIARLAEEDEFPHEIGLFLSYPPEDVYGFIYHRSDAKCCGCWKVYGNVETARRTFERYRRCSDLYRRLWQNGLSVEQLTVAV